MLWSPNVTGLSSTNRYARGIQKGVHAPDVAGVSRRWSGSIRQQRKANTHQLRLPWLPEQHKGRHVSWQTPGLRPTDPLVSRFKRSITAPRSTMPCQAALLFSSSDYYGLVTLMLTQAIQGIYDCKLKTNSDRPLHRG